MKLVDKMALVAVCCFNSTDRSSLAHQRNRQDATGTPR